MSKVKEESEIEKWPLFVDGICPRETNKEEIGTLGRSGSLLKDWNDPCTKANDAAESILDRSLASSIIFIVSISMVFARLCELKSHQFDDFNDETNSFNNGFDNGFEYELKYESECDALSSLTNKSIDAISYTDSSAFDATSTGGSSCRTNVIGHDLAAVLPEITVATIPLKNKHEMKHNTSLICTYAHLHQTPHPIAPITDRIFIFDLIGAVSRDFNDLECKADVALNKSEFKPNIHNIFNRYFNKNFDNSNYRKTYCCRSTDMYVFDFFVLVFLPMHINLLLFCLFCFVLFCFTKET